MHAVVTGVIATYPVGGVAWDYGQYALGLERLGFDVYYLEDAGLYTYDADTREYGEDPSYGVGFLERSLEALSPNLVDRWSFRSVTGESYGLGPREVEELVADADLFLNVSGMCLLRDEYLPSRRKVLIDTDPGWNHFVVWPRWDASGHGHGFHTYRRHDHFFTYAQNLGRSGCSLPDLGIEWHPTRPPVVLDAWRPKPPGVKWTTVMTWDNYGKPVEHNGVIYSSKDVEFERIETLPSKCDVSFELAVGGIGAPLGRWRQLGWSVVDSTSISRTLDDYRSYVSSSRGEFSVAKNIYVATYSGWFSCRSVCYLAAGRPVIVQDTGFSDFVPVGDGICAFNGMSDAIEAISKVEERYTHHERAAREVAQEYFAAEVVLSEILKRIGVD